MSIQALYIGRRFLGLKLVHAFLIDGKEITWGRIKGVNIGVTYQANRDRDGHTMARLPEQAGEQIPVKDWQLNKWRTESLAAEIMARRLKASKDVRKECPELMNISVRLGKILKGADFAKIRAVIEFLVEETWKEARRK